MKTPSLFAAPGNAPFATLADQAARVLSIGEELDPLLRQRLGCTGSLVQLLLQSTPVTTHTPGS
jgi:hypothetical protein